MRKYLLFGKKAEYEGMSWWFNFARGHVSLFSGKLIIHGANAMNWAVKFKTRKFGWICFTLPVIARLRSKDGLYLYFSPDGTRSSSTFYIGKDKFQKKRTKLIREKLGHNWDTNDENSLRIWYKIHKNYYGNPF